VPKKSRVIGEWKLDKAFENGIQYSSSISTYTFESDGKCELTYKNPSSRQEYTWYFDNKKEKLIIEDEKEGYALIFNILRLTSNEMWVEFYSDDDKYELQFEQK
jgi:hypothetical protein